MILFMFVLTMTAFMSNTFRDHFTAMATVFCRLMNLFEAFLLLEGFLLGVVHMQMIMPQA